MPTLFALAAAVAPSGTSTSRAVISTVPRALRTVDTATGEQTTAHNQRSDVCAVPAAGIVAEAMVALTIADVALEKFGGDSLGETRRNAQSYLESLTIK